MNVWIARDGETIGEYPREKLDVLAQRGELQKTDHYWHEGMDDWRELGHLIGSRIWEPLPASPPAPQRFPLIVGGIASALLVVVIAIAFVASRKPAAAPQSTPGPGSSVHDAARAAREEATERLIARLNELPKTAAPPRYTFYDSLAIQVPTPSEPLVVTIRGTENIAEPETLAAVSRTDFVLTAEFQFGKWILQRYSESHHDLIHDTITTSDKAYDHPVPPAIASLLGIETASR